jgi:hypothetical protein
LRHRFPDGRLENIFKEAAKALLERLERDKHAVPARGSSPPAPPPHATPPDPQSAGAAVLLSPVPNTQTALVRDVPKLRILDAWYVPGGAGKPEGAGEATPKGTGRSSRIVPRSVKRAVWARDGGRCAYTAPDGRRCESCDALEYDHIVAWADGGRSDTPDNIRLLCRAHNQRLGRRRFGPRRRG